MNAPLFGRQIQEYQLLAYLVDIFGTTQCIIIKSIHRHINV